MNGIKTTLLLGLLSGFLLVGGRALGGERGLFYGLVLAIGMNFFSYFFSEKMALMSSRAQRVSETEYPEIYARLAPLVRPLAERMGIPMPKLWVTPDLSPNAFATGRSPEHASVAVTSGILQIMKDRELAAVLAHELGHVKNRDILISSIAATMGSAITYLAQMAMWFGGSRDDRDRRGGSPIAALLMIFLAPLAAGLIRMAISRTREFSDDQRAGNTRFSGKTDSARRLSIHVAYVHHEAFLGRQFPEIVLHASAHGRTHCRVACSQLVTVASLIAGERF
jgi:heat shock protein HtpX